MRLQPLAAVSAASLLIFALAACAPEEPADPGSVGTDTPVACAPSGPISEAVTVTGDFGTEPDVQFNAPVTVPAVQRTVVIEGDGVELQDGALAEINFTVYNGATGKNLDSTGYGAENLFQATVNETALLSGLVKTLRCSTVGSRVVGVVPASEAFGDQGNTDLGVEAGQPVVFVVDVVDVLPTQVEGDAKPLPDGFPEVVWADSGQPTVTIPDADPPADLKIATVITGDGAVVGEGDNVTVQYQGVNWTSGEVFDQSWGRGPTSFGTNDVIAGFGAALEGQTVGSRVVVIIPPDQGYGPQGGNSGAGIAADDTLVFVIDILDTQAG
jgi:FKBP-type peptidyl-prolyl cis-trans isomerase